MDWTHEEVEAIVADYLRMLSLELSGQNYNKSAHRRALQQKLNSRSDGSIEFKHCNISAVMIELDYPPLRGYQPRGNYQGLLRKVVEQQLQQFPHLDVIALASVQQPAVVPDLIDFGTVESSAPLRKHVASDVVGPYHGNPVKRDYLAREARNRSLGLAGEEFVLRYEHWRLVSLGKSQLADCVEHVSKSKGDGLGYDVLSFDANGRERFVEVKTTAYGKETPFYVTRGELSFSRDARAQFHLCRVFDFRKTPRLFSLNGQLDDHCRLDPVTYQASFG
jgi:hypothetical protein